MVRSLLLLALCTICLLAQGQKGYYRTPELSPLGLLFMAEGDLWVVSPEGGVARRLTTHPAEELGPRVSPDGKTVAFTANYEGTPEVYTMPLEGGVPKRRTFGGATVVSWTPTGKILFSSAMFAGLPSPQLTELDLSGAMQRVPLAQALEGRWTEDGKTLYFARRPRNFSVAKRYQGGLAQTLYKWTPGSEAVALTADYAGTSENPMPWKGRLYFLSDRDGSMNLWSMDANGKGLKQHTRHMGFDVRQASLREGVIAYQMGADLHLFDIAKGSDRRVEISLASDFDHLRERWVKKPMDYLTSYSLSHEGDQVALVSRGRVFVAPVEQGRFVAPTSPKARYRDAYVIPKSKDLLVLSSETGELEWWRVPANGVGAGERLTQDGNVLRWGASVSPDGKKAVHQDKNNQLWLLDLTTKENKLLAKTEFPRGNSNPAYRGIRWSPDGRYFAYSTPAANEFEQVWIADTMDGKLRAVTTDRFNSGNPAWSEDGKWLYLISDRALRSTVGSPWGPRAPEPHFAYPDKVYEIALKKDLRSPFSPKDELEKSGEEKKEGEKKEPERKDEKDAKKPAGVKVEIDWEGITERLAEVPIPAGDYRSLAVAGKRLCYVANPGGETPGSQLRCKDINNKPAKPATVLEGVADLQVAGNGKKMLLRRGGDFFVVDAAAKTLAPTALAEAKLNLSDWSFTVVPQEEFKEAFFDAWRLHRDYFYDRKMHGVDWKLMRDKYGEFLARVRDRSELSDLIAQMISELNVMHNAVRGGDQRSAPDSIAVARLGAELTREADGTWKIAHIYRHDPDRPDLAGPLARPEVKAKEGDRILSLNGMAVANLAHPYEALKNQVNKQVLLELESGGAKRQVIVKPVSGAAEASLRYHEWEYTRRLAVEEKTKGRFGYVHLRAMGAGDIAQWAENYYPVFDREGLIIDVRHNNGGNIDSWLLGRLLRKAWMYWQPRVGRTSWNMQYAFRGPLVVLVDERTASDGEAFAEGFRRLGLGKVIGTRTWGGEIWLTSSNRLADNGVATAAELGVFGPNAKGTQEWLVEGIGVVPDIEVDNLPNATFNGGDAQLEAAIAHLEAEIKKANPAVPPVPAYPDKSLKGK
ncbi:MAG: S41 family peptidase [Bryobacter sp.]|nr:S41 family peptidase [Bryobacter sp.]